MNLSLMKRLSSAWAMLVFALAFTTVACNQRIVTDKMENNSSRSPVRPENVNSQFHSALSIPLEDPRILVFKSRRELELYSKDVLVRTYRIGLGFNPKDDKQREGDGRTPEGEFYIFTKNDRSNYYLSLGISYPNVEDAERGLRDGLISQAEHDEIVEAIHKMSAPPQNTGLGGQIYIHGNGAKSDWTLGCVALENEDMGELYRAVNVGTAVIIGP